MADSKARRLLLADLEQQPVSTVAERAARLGLGSRQVHNAIYKLRQSGRQIPEQPRSPDRGSGVCRTGGQTGTGLFTQKRRMALQRVAQVQAHQECGTASERGEQGSLTVRMDEGVIEALKGLAMMQGRKLSAVVRLAVLQYLGQAQDDGRPGTRPG